MRRPRLAIRLIAPLALGLVLYGGFQAFFVSHHLRAQSRNEATIDTVRLASTVSRTIRYDMLNIRREHIYEVIESIGEQEGIEYVRILNNEGRIVDSTRQAEVGTVLNRFDTACFQCHRGGEPAKTIQELDQARIFASSDGHRILAAIDVLYNEPACWNADCHVHTEDQSVLGLLDLGVSLQNTDQRVDGAVREAVLFAVISSLFVCGLVALFLHRFVHRPVWLLVKGTRSIAAGDLDVSIPVTTSDEMGQLADSFNTMTRDLRQARDELRSWAETLAEQVAEKTGELEAANALVLHSEKLSSIGLLAAGVAHELNNPLTGVITFAHLLLRRAEKGSSEHDDLTVIVQEAERCAAIIRQLLDFSRESPAEMSEQSLNEQLERVLDLLEHQALFHNVEVVRRLDDDLPLLRLDPDQFRQVFLNLIVNAAEAMPEGGTLTVSTRLSPTTEGDDDEIVVEISDTGMGIPEEALAKVFDPFYTTKDVGRGTGLGLSVTYGIISGHGGTITVSSQVGEGTTFIITLPAGKHEPEVPERRGETDGVMRWRRS